MLAQVWGAKLGLCSGPQLPPAPSFWHGRELHSSELWFLAAFVSWARNRGWRNGAIHHAALVLSQHSGGGSHTVGGSIPPPPLPSSCLTAASRSHDSKLCSSLLHQEPGAEWGSKAPTMWTQSTPHRSKPASLWGWGRALFSQLPPPVPGVVDYIAPNYSFSLQLSSSQVGGL